MGPLEILLIIVGISILVIVHESGHYLAARAFGIRVLRYSIGFGPTLFKYQPKGSPTVFQVAAIPFLAYVQVAGMNPHEDVDPDDPEIFPNKSLFARIVTIAAGPFANYLAACVIAFFIGVNGWPAWVETLLAEPARVGDVTPGSPAAEAGVESGDVFVAVDGTDVPTFAAVQRATLPHPSETLEYVVLRDGERFGVEVVPLPIVSRIEASSPAARFKRSRTLTNEAESLLPSDVLVSIEGSEQSITRAMRGLEAPVVLNFKRAGDERQITLTPEVAAYLLNDRLVGQIGVRSPESRPYGVGEAAWASVVYPWRLTALQLEGIARMVREASTEDLGGPVAMGQMIGSAAKQGASHYFAMIVILSVALGLFNLLPLPALDGGRLVFLGYEVVTRRRPNERFEAWVHTLGIVFLLGVLVLVTFRDIARLFE